MEGLYYVRAARLAMDMDPGPDLPEDAVRERAGKVTEDRRVNVEGRDFEASPNPGDRDAALLPGRPGRRAAGAAGLVQRAVVEAGAGRGRMGTRVDAAVQRHVLRHVRHPGRRRRGRTATTPGQADAAADGGGDGGDGGDAGGDYGDAVVATTAATTAVVTGVAAATSVAATSAASDRWPMPRRAPSGRSPSRGAPSGHAARRRGAPSRRSRQCDQSGLAGRAPVEVSGCQF